MALTPGTRLGAYEVIAQIGAGGMGDVYRARDTKLNRIVAIKVLPETTAGDPERRSRFAREAQIIAALSHPNIVTIFSVEEANGVPLLTMECVEGKPLSHLIVKGGLPLPQVLNLAIPLADAISAAHQNGITHRDLKPANVMVTANGTIKVLDFGLAKLRELATVDPVVSALPTAALTTEGQIIGTVAYMAPEQAEGKPLDQRADIFSLGVMLYELATGQRPFTGDTNLSVLSSVIRDTPPPVTDIKPVLPREFSRIVRHCLVKDPEYRYQSAKDLRNELRELREEQESGESGASLGSRASWRSKVGSDTPIGYMTRHRTIFILVTGTVALVTVAGLVGRLGLGRPSTAEPIDSVAVLPFVNANADPEVSYLADGIPESIINSLSQLPHLKVMSRNSAFRFNSRDINAQDVGHKLGVRAVLAGRVAQRGDALAISIELVDARDNSQVWGQQYNRKLADVFAMQEEMAKEVTERLRVKLTGAEKQQQARRPTDNLKAFRYYTQGRLYASRRTNDDLLEAIRYSEKAIEEDPNYALAYAGLSDAYLNLGVRGYIAPIEGRRKAEETARMALVIDENLAEAHVAVGAAETNFFPSPNFPAGDREVQRAIELSPSLALAPMYLGFSLVRQGRLDEALAAFLKAQELDPLSPIIARATAAPYYLKRDFRKPLALLRQADELGPAFSSPWEIGIYIQNGLFNEALMQLEQALRERKHDPVLIFSTGMVYATQGERARALKIIRDLEEMSGSNASEANWIAEIEAALNDKEMAFSWLDRGLATGAIGVFYKDEPVWDTIRSDRRFGDLLRRIGAPSKN
jgi:serine/threonine protein kinase/Flp pilus assembly protein TadD